jgi:hypothetical protein
VVFGHFAILSAAARVAQLLPDGALEKAFAALATDGSIMAPYLNLNF